MNDYISKPIIKRVIEDTLLSGQRRRITKVYFN
jgi:hypothetical protein